MIKMNKYICILFPSLLLLTINIYAQTNDEHIFDRGYHIQWSPDGEKIAFADWEGGHAHLWVYSFAENDAFEVSPDVYGDYYMSWLPNSEDLIFDANIENGPANLWIININETTAIPIVPALSFHPSVSPDGNYIAFCSGNDIMKISLVDGQLMNLANHQSHDFHPSWSPDGSKILFTSERSGNFDICII